MRPARIIQILSALAALATVGAGSVAPAQTISDAALRRMGDGLLPLVEELSGLEARRAIQFASRTRAELRDYLAAQMERDSVRAKLNAIGITYKRLGLIPDSTDLVDLSLRLLTGELAGYYDPRRDTLYVLEDVPAGELRAVLVHEMVHALQNQHAPLDSLLSSGGGGDRQLAARAAIEGHATLVMLLFMVDEATGQRLTATEIPSLRIPPELLTSPRRSPLFDSVPRILRESSMFPYLSGAAFVQALRRRQPGALPFGALLPLSSEQVIEPERRLLDERDDPTGIVIENAVLSAQRPRQGAMDGVSIPDSATEGDWTVVYENTLGQFELSILLMERHGLQAESVARGWDGDRYQLLSDGERYAVVWFSIWDDGRSAGRFADVYRQILRTRLGRSGSVEELSVEGRPVVRIVDAEEGVDLESLPRTTIRVGSTGT